jgi:manganese/zinc/iron transport system substrate-binding protein
MNRTRVSTFLAWMFCAVSCLGLNAAALGAAPLRVVSTTGMVNDLVVRVGGTLVAAEAIMGPGVDPHLYKATASDVVKMQQADVIFYNGLFLEGKMTEVFERMRKRSKHVFAVSDAVPQDRLLRPEQFEGHPDPHIWFDVEMWSYCLDSVAKHLSDVQPANRAQFETNAAAAKAAFAELHAWAKAKSAELSKEQRVLVTSHDAYNYFGRAYGFEVVGLQGISTVTEAALADMAKLTDFIKKRHIKAIFVESSVSHATIERISADSKARIGGELFSDAMGTRGKIENGYDLGTYEGMIKHNLNTIVSALK